MNIFKKNSFISSFLLVILFTIPTGTFAQEKTILETLVTNKDCNYVDKGLYLPFSKIDGSFPFFGTLVGECVDVKKNVGDMFVFGFKVFLGLVSIFAVVNISVAGIQYMINEKDTTKMRGAKKRLLDSVVGLIIAVSGYVILSTVNPKLTIVGFELRGTYLSDLIQRGANDTANIGVVAPGECIQGTAGCNDGTTPGGAAGDGGTPGTGNATGAITPNAAPTIFGYRDGTGYAGNEGDNGLGNGSWSPVSGWTYYNGGAHNPAGIPSLYSKGVALPQSTLVKDFGSAANVKNGAYEVFVGGKSIGAFPVVDNSASKFDLSYGLVKTYIDPGVTSSNSWSGAGKNITYKPLPNYWITNPRPKNPMVKDTFQESNPSAATVDAAVTNPNTFKVQ
ncbi:MAG: hypothetical protein V4686_02060 [Patescibacteria group bacterium]